MKDFLNDIYFNLYIIISLLLAIRVIIWIHAAYWWTKLESIFIHDIELDQIVHHHPEIGMARSSKRIQITAHYQVNYLDIFHPFKWKKESFVRIVDCQDYMHLKTLEHRKKFIMNSY